MTDSRYQKKDYIEMQTLANDRTKIERIEKKNKRLQRS